MSQFKAKILIGVTGSIAAYKACDLVSRLLKKGFDVQVAMTDDSRNFVGASTFEGLIGKPVLTDLFQVGNQMDHIHAVRNTDLYLIYPASANTINKLSAGICDNMVTTLFLANGFLKPVIVAPAMNSQMLKFPATERSISLLKEWGTQIALGAEGALACGEYGTGRLMEPQDMEELIGSTLKIGGLK
jgi:phosphopantothenoylcysteine decarboxylase/phosphopantothenate--cysteine ligase